MASAEVDGPQVPVGVSQSPRRSVNIRDRTDCLLLEIIRDNITTQYASQVTSLAGFRDAVSKDGGGAFGIEANVSTLLADFRTHVPLSCYDSYKPFIDKFNALPCREDGVVNLLAPGFPDFFALSSATSGTTPKMFPKYGHNARLTLQNSMPFDQLGKDLLAVVVCTGYKDVKEVERVPGRVVKRIPVCLMSGGSKRRALGWYTDDDENRMYLSVPNYAAPWAATVIGNLSSLLVIHGLFFLARRDVKRFIVTFAPLFVDLVNHIDEKWDVLVSSIRDGTVPDLQGIDNVRKYLEAHVYADPERAADLLRIGPPSSAEGWVARVWPEVSELMTICSGPFASVLPKVRSILGPNVAIRCPGYGASEGPIGVPHANKLDEFVLLVNEVIEFLDVTRDETHENICQAWEVEVGKQYEPILTTTDGLWRYQLGDLVQIIGFDAESKSPIFKFLGRKSSTICLPHAQIADHHLLQVITAIQADSIVQVQEFTSMKDDHAFPPTVGLFIEPMGLLGSDAHLAPQKIFDALVSINAEHRSAFENGQIRLPTIWIVKPGTFAAYRKWRGECIDIASGQIKVPVVLVNQTMQEWFLEMVVGEL